MNTIETEKQFWNKLAGVYDVVSSKRRSYKKMYKLICDAIAKFKSENNIPNDFVLEVGTGTGMIARAISNTANSIIATDYSELMINKAKSISHSNNILFEVKDASNLDYSNNSFDIVIISHVLHIVSNAEKILDELKRVLKKDGILIAPTFMWEERNIIGNIQKLFMLRKGFPIYTKWTSSEFILFLEKNGFKIKHHEKIKSSFSICFVVCEK